MRILALETSALSGSLALLEDGDTVAAATLPSDRRTAQSLAPALTRIFAETGWRPADVGLVAVTQGPGSFTGLRVGITTAKTFAYATGSTVLGINTLAAIASQSPEGAADVWAVIDAQRQQLFAARFGRSPDGSLETRAPTTIIDNRQWLAQLSPPSVVIGPGLRRLLDRLPAGVVVVGEPLWTPHAVTVGQLAFRDHQQGRRDDYWTLVPHYYRQSAAEEKRRAAEIADGQLPIADSAQDKSTLAR